MATSSGAGGAERCPPPTAAKRPTGAASPCCNRRTTPGSCAWPHGRHCISGSCRRSCRRRALGPWPRYFMPNLMFVSGLNSPLGRAAVAHHARRRRLDLHQADLAGAATRIGPVVAFHPDHGVGQRHRDAIGRGVAGDDRDRSVRPTIVPWQWYPPRFSSFLPGGQSTWTRAPFRSAATLTVSVNFALGAGPLLTSLWPVFLRRCSSVASATTGLCLWSSRWWQRSLSPSACLARSVFSTSCYLSRPRLAALSSLSPPASWPAERRSFRHGWKYLLPSRQMSSPRQQMLPLTRSVLS